MSEPAMLEVRGLSVAYGDATALDGVSLAVAAGEIVAIVGANGAGKTSLIRTIGGVLAPRGGSIRFEGREIAGWPSHRVCDLGIGQVAEGRQIFPALTVRENLEVDALEDMQLGDVNMDVAEAKHRRPPRHSPRPRGGRDRPRVRARRRQFPSHCPMPESRPAP